MSINTHGMVCDFGRHCGELYTRIPVSYLKWLANTPDHKAHDIAKAELERRGTVTPDIDISGHAIDRASLACRKIWHETRRDDEGLHAWLTRVAQESLEMPQNEKGQHVHLGIKFAFEKDGIWPVLKTVMRAKR